MGSSVRRPTRRRRLSSIIGGKTRTCRRADGRHSPCGRRSSAPPRGRTGARRALSVAAPTAGVRARLPSLPRCKAAVLFARNPTLHIVGIRYAAGGTAKTPRRLCAPLPDKRTAAGFPVQGSFFGGEKHPPHAPQTEFTVLHGRFARRPRTSRARLPAAKKFGRSNNRAASRGVRTSCRICACSEMTAACRRRIYNGTSRRIRTYGEAASSAANAITKNAKQSCGDLPLASRTADGEFPSRQAQSRPHCKPAIFLSYTAALSSFFKRGEHPAFHVPPKRTGSHPHSLFLYLLRCRQRKYVQLRLF